MSQPRVSDGDSISGDLVVAIDESSPPNTGGVVAYVVTVAAMLSHPTVEAGFGRVVSAGPPPSFPLGERRPDCEEPHARSHRGERSRGDR